ncbi:methyl-accepting chemotaxis protein [Paludibacterium paludis]|uniref:Methyl-accepting chemotaxis protein n=2 Tax=Paludibacterium paludis TaxID=1225769 RepID=A0A918P2R0_9NEIS|nr:methyl-accepting chemotaxis protein [Paludibacterium paludis]
MSIAARITAGFVLLLGLMFACGLTGTIGLSRIDAKVQEVTSGDLAFFSAMSDLKTAMGNLRRFEKDTFINIEHQSKRDEYIEKWKGALAQAREALKHAQGKSSDPSTNDKLGNLSALLGKYGDGFIAVTGQISAKTLATTAEANRGMEQHKESIHSMEGQLKDLSAIAQRAADELSAHIDETASSARTAMMSLLAVAMLAGLALAFVIVRSIRTPLNIMSRQSRALAETGDLRQTLPQFGRNELGTVASALATLVDSVRSLIRESHGHSSQLVNAADQLSQVSRQVANASRNQSEAAAASAAAVEEMTVSIHVVAESAQGVEEQALNTNRKAEEGVVLAEKAAQEIRRVAQGIATTSEVISQLNHRSGEIGDIVKVIHDIADQTNLLALNAAIEAARAGEMGRGFAVVADEVRKLAERTSLATSEIASRITGVQHDTQSAYQSMQEANASIDSSVAGAQSVSQTLEDIRNFSQHTVDRISDIAHAIKEQSEASQSIARNVDQIAQMNESTSRAVEDASALAQQLTSLSGALDTTLNRLTA